jgi:hypothetical protein
MNSYKSEHFGRAAWIAYAITAASALIGLGFSLAALGTEGFGDRYVLYALSRSVAIVIGVAVVGIRRSTAALIAVGLIMAVVQILDAGVGAIIHDPTKTAGPAVLAIASGISLFILSRANRRNR